MPDPKNIFYDDFLKNSQEAPGRTIYFGHIVGQNVFLRVRKFNPIEPA